MVSHSPMASWSASQAPPVDPAPPVDAPVAAPTTPDPVIVAALPPAGLDTPPVDPAPTPVDPAPSPVTPPVVKATKAPPPVASPAPVKTPTKATPPVAAEPAPVASAMQTLSVNSLPYSNVALDGKAMGVTGWSGSVSVGNHRVTLTTADGRSKTLELNVKETEPKRYCWDFAEGAECSR